MKITKDTISKFKNVNILVIGDIMIDRYWWGSIERISPEAPVPVVNLKKKSISLGGAANVVANVVGLGAKANIIGLIGNDEGKKIIPEMLKQIEVSSENLVVTKNRPTVIKTRIVAHNQHVVRIDEEENFPLSKAEENNLVKKIEMAMNKANIVILSDYAKGVISEKIISVSISLAKKLNIKVLVDPKSLDFTRYRGASLLTPNQKEILQALNKTDYFENEIKKGVDDLINNLNLEALLVTRGENGMALFQEKSIKNFPAMARRVFDVTGAGDTVIASLAVSLGSGFNFNEAVRFSNICAGVSVEKVGTSPVTFAEILKALH